MIYLASPYSHPDPAVREHRFQAACRAAARLIRLGRTVYSPIAHSHSIAAHGLPTEWEFWESIDRRHLDDCDEVVVLMLDGWKTSAGVQAEIKYAEKHGKPVWYTATDANPHSNLDPTCKTEPCR
jgi:nucleoside 2-deoxyribosyltransferase